MEWYFDFISPYAYLQSQRRDLLAADNELICRPVLFAGLLNHWGQLGPAEIPVKRQWTFEHVTWLATRDGIDLILPPEHPFNPIPLLRLCIAAGATQEVADRLFRFVWQEGYLPQHKDAFARLCTEFDLHPDDVNVDEVKATLHANGKRAIDNGVFGVPSIVYNGHLFWGYDASDMVLDCLRADTHPENWPTDKFTAARALPDGLQRKR